MHVTFGDGRFFDSSEDTMLKKQLMLNHCIKVAMLLNRRMPAMCSRAIVLLQ